MKDHYSVNFKRLTHLRRHFNRKNICKPLIKDIPIEELKEKYKVLILKIKDVINVRIVVKNINQQMVNININKNV